MNKLKLLLGLSLSILMIASCKRNPLKVDLSDIESEVEFVDFGGELFTLNGKDTLSAVLEIRNETPGFFDLFTHHIIRIGGIDDPEFGDLMKAFLNDTMIIELKYVTDSKFGDFSSYKKQLIKAFKYFSWHFPQKELPTIFTYVSGFNQSVVTAENMVGISLDKYLGRESEFYPQLSTTPHYKILNMYPERIPADVAFAWAITEFEDPDSPTYLLDHMVQKGKLMYVVDAMLPTTHDTVKIGYTADQLNWCKMNEPAMWTYLIENKMLYSTRRMDIVRYTNDAPTTSGFPLESPGRTGIWIGWQIVRQYMKKHPEVTLNDLMKNKDYQQILNDSGYNPE